MIRIERDEVESRPILLLGHSMGGLLIKQALINAHNNPKYTSIKDATTRLAFFAWRLKMTMVGRRSHMLQRMDTRR